MIKHLWGRITGADKRKRFPEQQASTMGRTGEYFILHPYGMFTDLPNGVLVKEVAPGVLASVTVDRPSNIAVGEPVFYHPVSGAQIVFRNSGDIDVTTPANLNVESADTVNITSSNAVNVTTTLMTVTGNVVFNNNVTVVGATTLSPVVTSGGKDISLTHTHVGSPSAPPGGVTPTGVVN